MLAPPNTSKPHRPATRAAPAGHEPPPPLPSRAPPAPPLRHSQSKAAGEVNGDRTGSLRRHKVAHPPVASRPLGAPPCKDDVDRSPLSHPPTNAQAV